MVCRKCEWSWTALCQQEGLMLYVIFANREESTRIIVTKREFRKKQCVQSHTHTQLFHPLHLWHVTLISWFPYTIHFLWVVIYWGGIFWKAGIVSCHNRSMGRWEFEQNVALPGEAVFSKCVGRHCRRQAFYGSCHVGGLTHFCVTAPAVYSRIKKK